MDKAELVGPLIQEGKRLVHALDAKGIPVSAAFWLYSSSSNSWRLEIASSHPDFNVTKSLFPAYEQIVDCVRRIHARTLTAADVKIIGTSDSLIKSLAKSYSIKDGEIRVQKTLIDDFYVEDLHIYRIDLPKKKFTVRKKSVSTKPSVRRRKTRSNKV